MTISANESLSAWDPDNIASTLLFSPETSTPSTVPDKTILPVIDNPLPNCISLPSEDNILFPAPTCIGASNSMLPLPEELNVISPSSVWSVMVSEEVSIILIDSPSSVVILNSLPVVDITC